MSTNHNGLTTETGASAKFCAISAAHTNGKAAVLAADSFAVTQSTLHSTVKGHSNSIDTMAEQVHNLEQQVKAIARVLASQNVQKLWENLKLSQDDLKRDLVQQMSDTKKDMLSTIEMEVAEVTDSKGGLLRKMEAVEAKLIHMFSTPIDDLLASRSERTKEIDKIKEMLDGVPNTFEDMSKRIKNLENRHGELKGEFRTFMADHDAANREQDRNTQCLTSEVHTALEAAKDKIAEETKSLTKLISKREIMMKEEVKEVRDLIDHEVSLREDSLKQIALAVKKQVEDIKADGVRKVGLVESSVDHKVQPCMAAIRDMKRAIDEEGVHRDTADKDIVRRLAKEVQDRHADEERLVGLISVCQEAVNKMHRPQVG